MLALLASQLTIDCCQQTILVSVMWAISIRVSVCARNVTEPALHVLEVVEVTALLAMMQTIERYLMAVASVEVAITRT